MKCYYIMIHWDGNAVSGFISFGETESEAMTQLKYSLIGRLKSQSTGRYGELSENRVKSFLRSLKRPWRWTPRGEKVVVIRELNRPIASGYWLHDIDHDQYICNLHEKPELA